MAGFSQCGGIGLALANWIVDGEPGMDVWPMDIARFGHWFGPAALRQKTRELYARRYTLTKPNEHLSAARPLRTTPLYDRLTAAGAVWGAQAGWEYPTHFDPGGAPERPSWGRSDAFELVKAECLAVHHAAGLFETSAYAKFMVEGPGTLDWIQSMTPNALPSREMRVGLAPIVSPSGRLAGDLTVTRLTGDKVLLIGSPAAEALYLRMLADAPPGVRLTNLTEALGGISLSGPRALAILSGLGVAVDHFGAASVDIGVAQALALGLSFTGEAGMELYAPVSRMRHIHDRLVEAGTSYGLRHIGVSALNSLRLEKLYPSFGSEISADVDPYEAGLGAYVKPGHASSALLARRGRETVRLCGLVIQAGDDDPVGGEPVLDGNRVIGRISSAAHGHRIGSAVALAYLPAALTVEGLELSVRLLGWGRVARLTLRPPYDPDGTRMCGKTLLRTAAE